MFGSGDLPSSTIELRLFLEKMKSPAFKQYFESVVDARLYNEDIALIKVDGGYKWQKKK